MNSRVLLMILDGWGIADDPSVSAIDAANVPFYRWLQTNALCTTLQASEEAVGLPPGQMGNSEVGHLHLGAGRVIWQELQRIQKAIDDKSILQTPAFQSII
ncbi:MAG: 2,3-bisphosphoglycerate-independent phosphoglycerate mutase, partial [Bacteroidia bacterium]|nr:2,3-bisphosphoglycerate-independent phosphoglycerate mutase [Bacteroidia bacterium]